MFVEENTVLLTELECGDMFINTICRYENAVERLASISRKGKYMIELVSIETGKVLCKTSIPASVAEVSTVRKTTLEV